LQFFEVALKNFVLLSFEESRGVEYSNRGGINPSRK
jgi:hypothetical protein